MSKQFLRTTAECFVCLSYSLGVCLSICPSVTLLYCIKTVNLHHVPPQGLQFFVTKFHAAG